MALIREASAAEQPWRSPIAIVRPSFMEYLYRSCCANAARPLIAKRPLLLHWKPTGNRMNPSTRNLIDF